MAPFRFDTWHGDATPIVQSIIEGGRARAQGLEAQGQAQGQAIQSATNAFSGTLSDMLKYNMQAPQRELTDLEVKKRREEYTDDQVTRSATQAALQQPEIAGIKDPTEQSHAVSDFVLQHLDGSGAIGAATKFRAQLQEARIKALDQTIKQTDLAHKGVEQASSLLQSVPEDKNPQAAYTNVLQQVRQLVGPDLAKHLPDQYDEPTVRNAVQWGMSAKEGLDYRRRAGEDARDALQNATSRVGLIESLTKSTAGFAKTITTPEEWDQMRKNVAALAPKDVTDQVLSRFDTAFAPDSPLKAEKLIDKTGFDPKEGLTTINGKKQLVWAGYDKETNSYFLPGDTKTPLKDFTPFVKGAEGQLAAADRTKLIDAVKANPSVWHQLTETARTQIAGDLHKQGFNFPAVDRGSSVATAERWKMTAMKALDDEFSQKRGLKGAFGMSQADYDKKKSAIDTSYQVQIGGGQPPAGAPKPAPAPAAPPPAAVPPAVVAPAAAPPPKPAAEVGPVTVKLPDGRIAKFKDTAARDAFMKAAGYTLAPAK